MYSYNIRSFDTSDTALLYDIKLLKENQTSVVQSLYTLFSFARKAYRSTNILQPNHDQLTIELISFHLKYKCSV